MARTIPLAVEATAMWLRLGIESGCFFWAAARPGMPRDLRRSLRVFASASIWSSFLVILMVVKDAGMLSGWAIDLAITCGGCISYLFVPVSLALHPRMALRPPQRVALLLDTLIVMTPVAVCQALLVRASLPMPASQLTWIIVYAVAQIAMVGSISALVTAGKATISTRSFWWFVAFLSTYMPMTLLGQVHTLTGSDPVRRAQVTFYYGGVLLALAAAAHLRRDPRQVGSPRITERGLFGLNPLTLLMPVFTTLALTFGILRHAEKYLAPLSATLALEFLLIIVRLALTTRENANLRAEELTAAIRIEQAREAERTRLMADVHDGFGSRLVSARILAAQEGLTPAALRELLDECLVDLHIVVDSLREKDGSLLDALADYRARLSSRLPGHSTRLHWRLDLGSSPSPSPRFTLHLLRFLEEATSNALKHANASDIWITVTMTPESALEASVADNGVGFAPDEKSGRGLDYLRIRARKLGGKFRIARRADGPGTSVTLSVPPEGIAQLVEPEPAD